MTPHPTAAFGRNRTSNIEQSTSNIERKDISNFDVQCSMFDVGRSKSSTQAAQNLRGQEV